MNNLPWTLKLLILIALFGFSFFYQSKGQFILAGQHTNNDHYVNYSPDTLTVSTICYNGNDSLVIDLNGDSIIDFVLYVMCDFELATSDWGSWLSPRNKNEIATGDSSNCR